MDNIDAQVHMTPSPRFQRLRYRYCAIDLSVRVVVVPDSNFSTFAILLATYLSLVLLYCCNGSDY